MQFEHGKLSYSCETVERVAERETLEIANVHAVIMHVAEKMLGWQKSQGEYPRILRHTLHVMEFADTPVLAPRENRQHTAAKHLSWVRLS